MKKLLLLGISLCAIGSLGVNILTANAATLTPAQTAELQQELQVAKATLVQLQMQEGQVPPAEAPVATAPSASMPSAGTTMTTPSSLSSADAASISSALGALKGALVSMQASFAANPQLVATKGPAVAATLGGIGHALAMIGTSIANGGGAMAAPANIAQTSGSVGSMAGSGVAQAAPAPSAPAASAPIAAAPAAPAVSEPSAPLLSANTPPATSPAAPAVTAPAATAPATSAPQSSNFAVASWNFVKAHWPTETIIVLVIAILLILFWPQSEEDGTPTGQAKNTQPQRPVVTSSSGSHQQGNRPSNVMPSASGSPASATPMGTVVASPATKVTVMRPQQSQQQNQQQPKGRIA